MKRKGLGAGDTEAVLLDGNARSCPESWSKDGRTILGIRQRTDEGGWSAWALALDGSRPPEPLLRNEWVDEPQVSADGRWLAYVSGVSGSPEVYIEPFRREGDRVQVSSAGGGQPKWRADGRELFYTAPDGSVMAVEVRVQGESLAVSTSTRLFGLRGRYEQGTDDFAPSGDGQRFLVKVPVQESVRPQLHVVTSWTSLLSQ
jgi:Tol biopolymer transport system component